MAELMFKYLRKTGDPAMLKVGPVEEFKRQEEALNKHRKFWDMY